MKILLSLCLLVTTSMATANTSSKHCGKFSPTTEVSRPLTIDEIERQEMAEVSEWIKVRSDIPKVPFGFGNAEWVAFKSRVLPGDNLVGYSTDRHSWQHFASETGYALMRSGCLIETFVKMRN